MHSSCVVSCLLYCIKWLPITIAGFDFTPPCFILNTALSQQHRPMCTFCSLLPIHSCELVIVLINPRGSVSRVSARNKYEVSMYALLKISIVCKWFIPKFALESFLPCWLITNWKIKFQIFYRMLNFLIFPTLYCYCIYITSLHRSHLS